MQATQDEMSTHQAKRPEMRTVYDAGGEVQCKRTEEGRETEEAGFSRWSAPKHGVNRAEQCEAHASSAKRDKQRPTERTKPLKRFARLGNIPGTGRPGRHGRHEVLGDSSRSSADYREHHKRRVQSRIILASYLDFRGAVFAAASSALGRGKFLQARFRLLRLRLELQRERCDRDGIK